MIDSWVTKNGDEIKIKDMTTQHIKNCIKAIEEDRIAVGTHIEVGYTGDGDGDFEIYDFVDQSKDYIRVFKEELKNRGE